MVDALPDVISAQGLTGCVANDGTCGKKIVGRGRCRTHYQAWWKRSRGRQVEPALNLKRLPPEQRFWAKVKRGADTECWRWQGSAHSKGHGEFFVSPERGRVAAHSYALEIFSGSACPDGLEACHRCDNPPCCNPRHIYFGTRQQNVDDMWRRNRGRRGSRHASAKVTEEVVLHLRRRFAAGDTQPDLAGEFGLSDSTISMIVNGKSWTHVGGPIKTHGRHGRRPTRKAA